MKGHFAKLFTNDP